MIRIWPRSGAPMKRSGRIGSSGLGRRSFSGGGWTRPLTSLDNTFPHPSTSRPGWAPAPATRRVCRLIWKILHQRIRYEERGPGRQPTRETGPRAQDDPRTPQPRLPGRAAVTGADGVSDFRPWLIHYSVNHARSGSNSCSASTAPLAHFDLAALIGQYSDATIFIASRELQPRSNQLRTLSRLVSQPQPFRRL